MRSQKRVSGNQPLAHVADVIQPLLVKSAKHRRYSPMRLNELPEMGFEHLFKMIGKSTMGFLTRQSGRVFES